MSAKDTSISAKKKEQIQAIEATDDQLTIRACLSFFTRSELIREAARLYIQRQSQWNDLFPLGDMAVQKQHLNEHDVAAEVKAVRESKSNIVMNIVCDTNVLVSGILSILTPADFLILPR